MRFWSCACWSWMPIRLCRAVASRAGSRPRTVVRPESALRMPSMHSMAVVLPAPLGPMSPKISPSNSWKERSSTATVEPYSLRRCATSITHFRDEPAGRGGGGDVSTADAGGCSRGGTDADHSLTPWQREMRFVRAIGFGGASILPVRDAERRNRHLQLTYSRRGQVRGRKTVYSSVSVIRLVLDEGKASTPPSSLVAD